MEVRKGVAGAGQARQGGRDATIIDDCYTTATQGSKGALAGPIVAIMTGGPAKDPNVEFPTMGFEDYRTTIDLDPARGVTTCDFDVPSLKKP